MHNTHNTAFFDDVLKASYAAPVVVMFHASWCGPCRGMKPLVEAMAAELGFTLVGVDAGEQRDLAAMEGVRGVPTIIVYRNAVAVGQPSVGGKTEAQLRSFLAAAGV
jgi:putative thioredoxin